SGHCRAFSVRSDLTVGALRKRPTILAVSIVTKTGDKGETSLMYGRRLSKSDPRVDAYGCVDELSAALGLARSISPDKFVSDQIFAVQKDLIREILRYLNRVSDLCWVLARYVEKRLQMSA